MTRHFFQTVAAPALCAIGLCLAPAPLRADAIRLLNGLTYDGLRIDRVEEGQVYYNLNGQDQSKPVTEVVGLKLDDEPDFDAGEASFELQKWDGAVQGYLAGLSSTQRPWLKQWIAPRLMEAAVHLGRFDAQTAAWVAMVNQDPAAAAKNRPSVPQGDNPQLAAAAVTLNDAAGAAHDPGRRMLLGFLLDVQLSRRDLADADAVAKELEADARPDNADPAEQGTQVALARLALLEKNYNEALRIIDAASPILTDPDRQAEALFVKAQAMENKAAGDGAADDWKDAALEYLRVYVHFPASGHAAESLLAAARIEEQDLHEPRPALNLYQKVVSQFGQSAAALEAGQAVKRLNAAVSTSRPVDDR